MSLKEILPGKLGFGAAPLGNMFRDIPDAEQRRRMISLIFMQSRSQP